MCFGHCMLRLPCRLARCSCAILFCSCSPCSRACLAYWFATAGGFFVALVLALALPLVLFSGAQCAFLCFARFALRGGSMKNSCSTRELGSPGHGPGETAAAFAIGATSPLGHGLGEQPTKVRHHRLHRGGGAPRARGTGQYFDVDNKTRP